MSLVYKRSDSPYWYVTKTRESTKTINRKNAEEFARRSLESHWRATDLGEELHTWRTLRLAWFDAKEHKASIDRDVAISDDFEAYLEPRDLVDKTLCDVTATIVLGYGALVKARSSPSNANRCLAHVRAMLNYAASKEWLVKVPNIDMYEIAKREPTWLTYEQASSLVALLPHDIADIVNICLHTGMRYSNASGLMWDWLTDGDSLAIVPAVAAKTKRTYTVPLSSVAKEIVQRRRPLLSTESKFVIPDPDTGLPYKRIRAPWEAACKKLGITARPHDLRHTWATWHLQNGTPDRVIQEAGGWASPAMLQRYAHHSKGYLAKYADNLLEKK